MKKTLWDREKVLPDFMEIEKWGGGPRWIVFTDGAGDQPKTEDELSRDGGCHGPFDSRREAIEFAESYVESLNDE